MSVRVDQYISVTIFSSVRVGVGNLFGSIDRNISVKKWILALEWAWHTDETNFLCAGISRICMPSPSIAAFIVSERSFGQTDMAISTQLH